MVKFHSHVNAYQRVFLHLTVWEWAFRHVETSEFSPSFRGWILFFYRGPWVTSSPGFRTWEEGT